MTKIKTSRFSYIYFGGNGKRIPCDTENVTYAAGISTIKAKAAFDSKGITSVIHPNLIITIENKNICVALQLSTYASPRHFKLLGLIHSVGAGPSQGWNYHPSSIQ